MDRRSFLAATGVCLTGAAANKDQPSRLRYSAASNVRWPICLNTSTIRPAQLEEKIAIAAETGYDGIEIWVEELEKYAAQGGDVAELGKRIADRGLFVPNVIGLWDAMPAGNEAFEASLEATRKRMALAAAVGSQHVAAIPAPDRPDFDLAWAAHCYRTLLDIGSKEYGLTVAFEFVGFLKGIHRLGQACAVAIDADDVRACLIADAFHLYRGGSGFDGLNHLNGAFIAVFHWNDVPSEPAAQEMGDKHRIYPGDGVLPLAGVLRTLKAIGYIGPLSLELFNETLWSQDPRIVAETGLRKIRAQIEAAQDSIASA